MFPSVVGSRSTPLLGNDDALKEDFNLDLYLVYLAKYFLIELLLQLLRTPLPRISKLALA